jgi:hypothetical protein
MDEVYFDGQATTSVIAENGGIAHIAAKDKDATATQGITRAVWPIA